MTKSLITFPYEGERYAGLFINVASAGIISGLALSSVMIYFIYMLKKGEKNIWKYVACAVLAVYPMYGLYITENRTGMMGPVMVLVFWFLFLPKKRSWKVYAVRWGLMVGAVVTVLILGYQLYQWTISFKDIELYSREVRIINSFQITKQPEVTIDEDGENAHISIEAMGAVHYQWQYGNGETWKECVENENWSDCQGNRLTVRINECTNSYRYRCALLDKMDNFMCSDECSLGEENRLARNNILNGSALTIATAVEKKEELNTGKFVITVEPEDITATVGEMVQFHVEAPGNNVYQWQYFDGEDWKNLTNQDIWTGYETDILRFEVDITNIGYRYRCYINKTAGEQINECFYPFTGGQDKYFIDRLRLSQRRNGEQGAIFNAGTFLNFIDVMSSWRLSIYVEALRTSTFWGTNELKTKVDNVYFDDPHSTLVFWVRQYGWMCGVLLFIWLIGYVKFSIVSYKVYKIYVIPLLYMGMVLGVSISESQQWSEPIIGVLLAVQYSLFVYRKEQEINPSNE